MKKKLFSIATFLTASLLTAAQTVSSGDVTLNYIGYSSGSYIISVAINIPDCSPTIRVNWNGRNQDSVIQLSPGTTTLTLPGDYISNKPIRIKSSSSCASTGGWLELTPASTVLPVKLSYFGVTRLNGIVTINWTTASEENISRFIVERSSNGVDFYQLRASVPRGTGTTYKEQDNVPLPGRNYYRIRTVDNDSRNYYSSVRIINTDTHDIDVVILDFTGRLIAKGKDSLVRGLPPGIYIVNCKSGIDTWQEKITIQ